MSDYLVIDSDNYKASGIDAFFFPGGEPHVRIPDFRGKRVLLFLKLRTWNDAGLAACLMDALGEQINFVTFIPYFPGARQDRTDGFTPTTKAIYKKLLGSPTFVFDEHSLKVSTWAKNFHFTNLKIEIKDDVVGIIAPDKGAEDRALAFRDTFYPEAGFIQADKTRDFATGALTGYKIPKLTDIGRYIIVDDICDGGGTFNLLANAFDNDLVGNKSKLELFVSHGIFSKGVRALSPKIEHITTTNSWCDLLNIEAAEGYKAVNRLTVLLLEQLFDSIMV